MEVEQQGQPRGSAGRSITFLTRRRSPAASAHRRIRRGRGRRSPLYRKGRECPLGRGFATVRAVRGIISFGQTSPLVKRIVAVFATVFVSWHDQSVVRMTVIPFGRPGSGRPYHIILKLRYERIPCGPEGATANPAGQTTAAQLGASHKDLFFFRISHFGFRICFDLWIDGIAKAHGVRLKDCVCKMSVFSHKPTASAVGRKDLKP